MVESVRRGRVLLILSSAVVLLGAQACGTQQQDETINVLMVNNPQMVELQQLTANVFTRDTGIKVNFTLRPENQLRDEVTKEFTAQAGRYDIASISNFEAPLFARQNLLSPLSDYAADDADFDQDDIIDSIRSSLTGDDGKVYAEPFYGESSFLMYRLDVLNQLGIKLPATPTWQQVADAAAAADQPDKGMRGICLRGQPGWGEMIAPMTTVVNTFGGAWFSQDWRATVDSPEFSAAAKFYINLAHDHGEDNAANSGYAECLDAMLQGKVAMWYDSTAGATQLEAPNSLVRGKVGYLSAPVTNTSSSGWLYAWAWGMERASKHQDAAWKFISWASGKKYEQLAAQLLGGAKVPAGKRKSTYADPQYLADSGAFASPTELAIESVNPLKPGVQPRPTPGIQFVDVPEFQDLGNKTSQLFSSAIAGDLSAKEALQRSQELAEQVAAKYRR
ncbi:extracellular solute-binding protein [Amycolatopsis sp. NBC_00345]|uniref:extracellular solute-binding protein n=1 Tax=Amycolatopsis sp. NBC_00345 TaxID=2975955 RepID=UPI002E26B8CC